MTTAASDDQLNELAYILNSNREKITIMFGVPEKLTVFVRQDAFDELKSKFDAIGLNVEVNAVKVRYLTPEESQKDKSSPLHFV